MKYEMPTFPYCSVIYVGIVGCRLIYSTGEVDVRHCLTIFKVRLEYTQLTLLDRQTIIVKVTNQYQMIRIDTDNGNILI